MKSRRNKRRFKPSFASGTLPTPKPNNRKTVMIIAAGRFQSYAIKAAKKLGYNVIASDMNPFAEGLKFADYSYVVSSRNIRALIEVARYHSRYQDIDGVCTVGTDVSHVVAAIQEALNLPGIGYKNALAATNKALMRERLQEHNVPIPAFRKVATLSQAELAAEELGYPIVLKPTDCMGARGVCRVDSAKYLPRAFFSAFSITNDEVILAEEYMDGPELSIDALIINNKVHFLVIGDRIIKFPPHFVETGHNVPSRLPLHVQQDALQAMEAGIKALGITTGAAKGDIKITSKGVKVGEIAARLSGGFMSSHTLPLSTGIDAIEAAIQLSVGEIPEIPPPKAHASVERAILPGFGKVHKISGVKSALSVPGVKEIFIDVSVGDVIRPLRNNMGKAGHIITAAPTLVEAEEAARKARNRIHFGVSPV